jgi:DNA-binding PadR family transcriptional regulator
MANPTPQQLAELRQQQVLAILTMPFYVPKGKIDAAKLCLLVNVPWRGRRTPKGKEGGILSTAENFIGWFEDQGLITKKKIKGTVRGRVEYEIAITQKGRERLEQLRESIAIEPVEITAESAPRPSQSRWEPIQGIDEIAIRSLKKKVHQIDNYAAADLARRKRIQERKLRGGQNAG